MSSPRVPFDALFAGHLRVGLAVAHGDPRADDVMQEAEDEHAQEGAREVAVAVVLGRRPHQRLGRNRLRPLERGAVALNVHRDAERRELAAATEGRSAE
ncbi:unnamed protein product [Protopolystoma xenopodis]|uniref:Uncharacterized protein n=1 Tax=Protopolystoma xenopodis TaxID=117903 RepID=A0A3S5AHV0_9PLAT|nr:unnamed protein product [Protopolystoma xenopodis]